MLPDNLQRIFEEERNKLDLNDTLISIVINQVNLSTILAPKEVVRSLNLKEKINLILKTIKEHPNVGQSAVSKDHDNHYIYYVDQDDILLEKKFRRHTRHELYHIAAGHCDFEYSLWKNIVFDIPATLYQYCGVKFHR